MANVEKTPRYNPEDIQQAIEHIEDFLGFTEETIFYGEKNPSRYFPHFSWTASLIGDDLYTVLVAFGQQETHGPFQVHRDTGQEESMSFTFNILRREIGNGLFTMTGTERGMHIEFWEDRLEQATEPTANVVIELPVVNDLTEASEGELSVTLRRDDIETFYPLHNTQDKTPMLVYITQLQYLLDKLLPIIKAER